MGLVSRLKFLIIILYCIWQIKHLNFLEKNQNFQGMVNFYLVYYIWIFWILRVLFGFDLVYYIWILRVLFGFEEEFENSIKFGLFFFYKSDRIILIYEKNKRKRRKCQKSLHQTWPHLPLTPWPKKTPYPTTRKVIYRKHPYMQNAHKCLG